MEARNVCRTQIPGNLCSFPESIAFILSKQQMTYPIEYIDNKTIIKALQNIQCFCSYFTKIKLHWYRHTPHQLECRGSTRIFTWEAPLGSIICSLPEGVNPLKLSSQTSLIQPSTGTIHTTCPAGYLWHSHNKHLNGISHQ